RVTGVATGAAEGDPEARGRDPLASTSRRSRSLPTLAIEVLVSSHGRSVDTQRASLVRLGLAQVASEALAGKQLTSAERSGRRARRRAPRAWSRARTRRTCSGPRRAGHGTTRAPPTARRGWGPAP